MINDDSFIRGQTNGSFPFTQPVPDTSRKETQCSNDNKKPDIRETKRFHRTSSILSGNHIPVNGEIMQKCSEKLLNLRTDNKREKRN